MTWLSNTHVRDVRKITAAFPFVVEGAPKATSGYTVEKLAKQQIVGLYKPADEASK